MENEIQKPEINEINKTSKKIEYLVPASLLLSAIIIAGGSIYSKQSANPNVAADKAYAKLEATVLPVKGFTLPIKWGDLGIQMTRAGVIDKEKFMTVYANRGGVQEFGRRLLEGANNDQILMTPYNANFLLNLFWALGLGNKNDILEKGPMMDKQYGGAGRFASTGGWSLARGQTMNHYSMHKFMDLTSEQQALVERVSKNIYRPCCGNSVYFPDCNHGMAMLGLLELMASQGVSERDMYKVALQVNAYWFPDTYLTIAKYLELKGSSWGEVDPGVILGADYSSSAGYQKILNEVSPPTQKGGGSCGV